MLKLLVTMALVGAASAGLNGITSCTSATADVSCDVGFSLEVTPAPASCALCVPKADCAAGTIAKTAAVACPAGNTSSFSASANDCVDCTGAQTDADGVAIVGNFAHATAGCTACAPGAATCTDAAVALTCLEGFSLEADVCTACVLPAASVCAAGKAPTTAAAVCAAGNSDAYTVQTVPTGTGCADCTGAQTDADGVAIVGNFAHATAGCTACAAGAATCTDAAVALTCLVGFWKDGDVCTACDTMPAVCSTITDTICNDDKVVDDTKAAVLCAAATCSAADTAACCKDPPAADATTAASTTGLSGAASVHASSALVAGLLVALGFAQ